MLIVVVWPEARSYDNFWTQSGRRMSGFSDVPLNIPSGAPLFHDTFQAKYVTQYLEAYINSHVYDGTTLRSRILFDQQVQRVEKTGGIWTIQTTSTNKLSQLVHCSKLVVATGHTSIPNLPAFLNQEVFKSPIIHHKSFGEASRSVLNDSNEKNITVLGGGKSAVDMVYESVKRGCSVSWVIRKSGEGPALFFPAPSHGRYRNSVESSATRYKACFSPSSFMPNLWLPRLFHRTGWGKKHMASMVIGNDENCHAPAEYRTRKGALPGFENLDFTTS